MGNGSATTSQACPCGYIATFSVGTITQANLTYISTLGFTCRQAPLKEHSAQGAVAKPSCSSGCPEHGAQLVLKMPLHWHHAAYLTCTHCFACCTMQ